jgi:hypothetical protein
MFDPVSIIGQWAGFFEYGPEYGSELYGEKVQFRLFIETFKDGQFTGKAADLEGIGSNFLVAKLSGFIDGDFISFTKEYPHYHTFDEDLNTIEDKSKPHPVVSYEGHFHSDSQTFKGTWEIQTDIERIGDRWRVQIDTGKWEIVKDD